MGTVVFKLCYTHSHTDLIRIKKEFERNCGLVTWEIKEDKVDEGECFVETRKYKFVEENQCAV